MQQKIYSYLKLENNMFYTVEFLNQIPPPSAAKGELCPKHVCYKPMRASSCCGIFNVLSDVEDSLMRILIINSNLTAENEQLVIK